MDILGSSISRACSMICCFRAFRPFLLCAGLASALRLEPARGEDSDAFAGLELVCPERREDLLLPVMLDVVKKMDSLVDVGDDSDAKRPMLTPCCEISMDGEE